MTGSGGGSRRWESLFDDLEAAFESEQRLDLDAEVAERTRRERAQIPFMGRLAGALHAPVTLDLISGHPVRGELRDLGADWLLLEGPGPGQGVDHLIPVAAVTRARTPTPKAQPARTARRFGLGAALRTLSRNRAGVTVVDIGGVRTDGTIDAVGADFLDLAEHAHGEWRRTANVTGRVVLPFCAIAEIRSLTALRV